MAKLMYKIAIELAQSNLLMNKVIGLTEDDVRKLRGHANRLVKQSHGFISLNKANDSAWDLNINLDT